MSFVLLSFKSNQIKSLLLSHHHSTSALVSEILESVLQTVQKNKTVYRLLNEGHRICPTIFIERQGVKQHHCPSVQKHLCFAVRGEHYSGSEEVTTRVS